MKYGSQHKIIGGILVEKEMIIVLDFGGQYNQLIARRVRECNVYCEVHPYTLPLEKIKEMNRRVSFHRRTEQCIQGGISEMFKGNL